MAFRRIRSQIILSFCVLMVAGGLVTTARVYSSLSESLRASAAERAAVVAELLAGQLEPLVRAGDWERAQLLIDAESDHNAFVVLESGGRVLVGSTHRGLVPPVLGRNGPAEVEFEGEAIASAPASLKGDQRGMVHVGVSLAPVYATTKSVVRDVFSSTLGAMLAGIAGIFLLAGLITRPIRSLMEAASSMGQGDLSAKARVSGRNELASLAVSFNTMAQQIRDRVKASEELRDYFEGILDHLTKSVLVCDRRAGTVAYANASARTALGVAPGDPLSRFFGHGQPLGNLPEAGGFSSTLRTSTGKTLAISGARLGTSGDSVVVSVNDVTELTQLSDRLQRAERLAAAGEVASGIVHAVNNPLDGVRRAVDLASRHAEEPARVKDLLELAREGTDRIAAVTRSLLSFARADEAGARAEVDARDLVAAAVDLVSLRAEEAGVTIRRSSDGPTPNVLVSAAAITDVLVNLLSNALDVAPRGSEVRVVVSAPEPSWVEIRVEDTGPGVPEGLRQRVFEPFFTTKDAQHGTGLGLSMARRIVEAAGGTIQVRSPERTGAVFAVRVPAGVGLAHAESAA